MQTRQEAEYLMEQQHYPPDYQEEYTDWPCCDRCGAELDPESEKGLCNACLSELHAEAQEETE